jgi:hypothetical protein
MADRPVGHLIITLGYSVEYGGRDGFIDDLYLVPEVRGWIGAVAAGVRTGRGGAAGGADTASGGRCGQQARDAAYRVGGFEETADG